MHTRARKGKPANKAKPATKHVQFNYNHPTARSVCIAGTFNDWHPSVTEMIKIRDGQWANELVLPAGIYEYRFVVDAEWLPDPAVPETAPNPFGGINSIVRVSAE